MDRLRDPRLLDWLVAVVLAGALELQLRLGEFAGAALLNAASALLLTLPLAARRRAPLAVAVVYTTTAVLSAIVGAGLFDGEPPPFASLVAGALAFYSLGAYAEDRAALAGAGFGVAGLWTCVIAGGHAGIQIFLFSGGLIVATPWLVGRSGRARMQRIALLEREQRQRERVAVGEERARIARELHDVVAHSVGAMVAQAQGAGRVMERDPERAREALEAIERTGRTALDEMRRSLGVLRRTDADAPLAPQPGLDELDGPRRAGARQRADRRARHRGRAGAAAGGRRPIRLPDRPGGADEHAQARRPGAARASPCATASASSSWRSPTTAPAAARRAIGSRTAVDRGSSGCASASRCTAASCRPARARRAASSCARRCRWHEHRAS